MDPPDQGGTAGDAGRENTAVSEGVRTLGIRRGDPHRVQPSGKAFRRNRGAVQKPQKNSELVYGGSAASFQRKTDPSGGYFFLTGTSCRSDPYGGERRNKPP